MACAWKELRAVLPPRLWTQIQAEEKDTQEIRLRLGLPPTIVRKNENKTLCGEVQKTELEYVVNMACRYSPWTVASVSQGYITIPGGHRIGLCGQAVMQREQLRSVADLGSVNIRICRDIPGVSGQLGEKGGSILLLGPPGSGKTTLLRDMIRRRSRRENVAVVDERGEIFPTAAGFAKGQNTDILTGCGKAQGIEMMLRVMGPQCIAVDEITAQEDCEALLRAGKCGVSLLATAHAWGTEDLRFRPVYARMLESRLFETAVILRPDKSWRTERMIRW